MLLSLGGIRQCVAKHRFVYGQAYIVRDPKGWYRFVGLNAKGIYLHERIKQDVRDRMVVSPFVAMVYKKEIREWNG